MSQGERIYSLGNPLDIGFAVIEGTYNGLVERSFYPTIFFAGSLNPGVSGGPTLDQQGRVIGINVAARRDGEQVSFLVPAAFAEDLLQRGRDAAPLTAPAYPELTRQLMTHQAPLTDRFLGEPLAARRASALRHSAAAGSTSCAAGAAARRPTRRASSSSAPTARWTRVSSSRAG